MAHRRNTALSLLVAAMLVTTACTAETTDSTQSATDVINDYVAAYNAGDIDLVMGFFSEDSVVMGHPAAQEAMGLTAIRDIHEEVGSGDTYTITIQDETGNTITWDHIWHTAEGENCVDGHTAVIANDKFVSWDWPITNFQC